METNVDIDVLIVNRLMGTISESDNQLLEEQLKSDKDLANRYNKMAKIWSKSATLSRAQAIENKRDIVWQKIERQTIKKQHNIFNQFLRIAAVLIPIFAIGIILSTISKHNNYQTFATTDSKDSITLSDNTTIILNNNSKILYEITENRRHVIIEGMAFFKVSRDENRPFTIDANQTKVTVLGTKFSVENIAERNRVNVIVTEGKVNFASDIEQLDLLANQSATCSLDGHITLNKANNCNWISGNIKLHDASLEVVIENLLSYYPEIKGVKNYSTTDSTRVTTEFGSQSLDDVLAELNIHFEKKIVLDNGYLMITD